MARMAASVSAYAVSNTRLASGKISMASPRNSTPDISGIRWSTRNRPTDVLRSFRARTISSAVLPESALSTRYWSPYSRLRSRATALSTVGSSSTATITGFSILRVLGIGGQVAEQANRRQGQFFHQPLGLRTGMFRFRAATLLFVPIDQRLETPRQVGPHVVAAVVIEGGIEILFCTFEVTQLRIPLTEGLRDERDGIVIGYRLGIREGASHVLDCLGVSSEEPCKSESGTHLVRYHF